MSHSCVSLLVHVVFSTKYRRPAISDDFRERLFEYMAGIARNESGYLLRVGGTRDHVHVLVSLRGDVSIAEAVRKWKCVSSGWVHKTWPSHAAFAWQTGYSAFSVSASNINRVVQYIAGQEEHHRKMEFFEELAELARLHRKGMLPSRAVPGFSPGSFPALTRGAIGQSPSGLTAAEAVHGRCR